MLRLSTLFAIPVACALLMSGGCNSSTGPDGSPEFSFLPAASSLTMDVGETTVFSYSSANATGLAAQWKKDGKVVSQADSFSYLADASGDHEVRVELVYDGGSTSHQWTVTVSGGGGEAPPPVGNVQVANGSQVGSIRVSWTAVAGSAYPIASYVIGCSFAGNLDVGNWDAADVQVTVPADGGIGYVKELTQDDGMIPGSRVWVGVRCVDERGVMSPLPASHTFTISYPWYLSGRVRDDHGEPLASVILHFETGSGGIMTQASGADGSFDQGPFSSADSVRVKAVAIDPDYYTFTSAYRHAADQTEPLAITMLYQYGADASCNANGGDFLAYLRYMTGTDSRDGPGILHKWRTYPVRVFIPDLVRDDGVDFGALCLQALEFWNDTVGEDLLARVDEEAAADVIVDFVAQGLFNHGQVELLDPQGSLGAVTPRLMGLDIDASLVGEGSVETGPAVEGVCLHEFGHVLGLYRHSSCDGYRLMNDGNGVFAFQPENSQPIADDEINAIRALRNLDDGVDLAGYEAAARSAPGD